MPYILYIKGYANVFDVLDAANDIVKKGTFQKSIESNGAPTKLLWQHIPEAPIGKILQIREDEYGLLIKAEIVASTQAGREAAALIKANVVTGLSVGIIPRRVTVNPMGYKEILDAMLYEVSVVTFPANHKAEIFSIQESKKEQGMSKLLQCAQNLKEVMQQLK